MSRDRGLQPERTGLAWRRTALAQAVVAVLLVRLALTRGTAGLLAAAAVLIGWVVVFAVAYRRMGAPRRRPDDADGPAGRTADRGGPASGPDALGGAALPLSALTAVGFAVLGLLLILVH